MDKTQEYYQHKIADEIHRISKLEANHETGDKFWETLKTIKPKSCEIKSGACSGEYISFTLAFEKNGAENSFDLFTSSIPDAAFSYGLIFGLNPEVFSYDPKYSYENETHHYLIFKLIKNGQEEKDL